MMGKSGLLVLLTTLAVTAVKRSPRIIGGDRTDPDEYPYFVWAGPCGGALIAPDVALFAAHCPHLQDRQVVVGAHERGGRGAHGERFCEEWIKHPDFVARGGRFQFNHDFGLCKLGGAPVELDVSRVRLELNEDDGVPSAGDDLLVMGLGRDEAEDVQSVSDVLQDVSLPYIGNEECNSTGVYDGEISDAMLCAGVLGTGGKDSCTADSGGPLVQRIVHTDGTLVDRHVGVVSWGYECASEEHPGVYARTSAGYPWIRNATCRELGSVASYCDHRHNHNNTATTKAASLSESCEGSELVVRVATDQHADKLSWSLYDSKYKTVMARKYLVRNYQNTHTVCLDPEERYEWVLRDKRGFIIGHTTNSDPTGAPTTPSPAPLCGEKACGSYSLALNGRPILSGTEFDRETRFVIEAQEAPSASPTMSSTTASPPTLFPMASSVSGGFSKQPFALVSWITATIVAILLEKG